MKFHNNEVLRRFLRQGGAEEHLNASHFDFDEEEFGKVHAQVVAQYPEHSLEESLARAAYRMLTSAKAQEVPSERRRAPAAVDRQAESGLWHWLKVAWAIAVLLLLAGILKAHGQDRRLEHIRADFHSPIFAQVGGLIVQFQNQGTTIGTYPAFLRVNCSTNVACSASGVTVTITASSTASTAFSAITAATNSNAGTFSASGNTWDFTAATLFKLRTAANLTTSANGDLGWDSTTGYIHAWRGADRLLIPSTNIGTSGQVPLSNADGSATFGDPVVSQPTASNLNAQVVGNVASAASDSGNPIKVGCIFNSAEPTVTTGQRVDIQCDANGHVKVVIQGTPTFSLSGTADVSDRAGRLLGVVYGSQGQQLQQSATNFNLFAELRIGGTAYDARQIRTLTSSDTATAVQGNAGSNAQAWWARIGDATNGPVAVKPASTAVAAADPSLAVGLSPNSPVPTGSNTIGKVDILGNAGANIDAPIGSAPPPNAPLHAGLASGRTGGNMLGVTVCDSDAVINISTATTTLEITGVSGRQVRICGINILAAAADNVALIEGTGATCGTGTAGMAGGTTAATGWNFAANGGLTQGSGLGEVMTTATAGDSVCLVTSAAVQLSGHIKYTIY